MKNFLDRGRAITGTMGSALLLAIGGCGGGSNGGSDQPNEPLDTSAPIVSETYPASAETGVPRSAPVSAFFTEQILTSSLSADSFTLVGNDPVDGTLTFDASANEATFTPNRPLAILTTYTATLETGISDLAGNTLDAKFSWDFTTGDGTLSTSAEQVHADGTSRLINPQVIYHDNGDAIAVWVKWTLDPATFTSQRNVWVNHYRVDSGWGTPFSLQEASDTTNNFFSVATDDSGNAIVGWHKGHEEVWVRHYNRSADTWGSAVKLNAPDVSAFAPQIAMDNSGNAIALWMEQAGGNSDIWASYYTADDGWGTPENIEYSPGDAHHVQVAMDANGNAVAAWDQNDGTYSSVYANHFVVGAGWGTPTLLENDDSDNTDPPQVSVDASGNALAIWTTNDGSRYNLWYNYYDVNNGWGSATLLRDSDIHIGQPLLAMNTKGTAIVTWANYDPVTTNATYASKRYTPGEGWGNEETFDYTSISYYNSAVTIDNNGNALFFWEYDDGTNGTVWFNRYTADGGWAEATQLTSMGDDYGDWSPVVSVNRDGEGMVLFAGSASNEEQLWTRVFK